jgi:hypothetical protein
MDELILSDRFPSKDAVHAAGLYVFPGHVKIFREERERRELPIGIYGQAAQKALHAEKHRILCRLKRESCCNVSR